MAGTGIEAPYTLVSLPKPLDRETGRIQAAPVFGLRESKKRKRHEVVVGIDGESVNIYNVQTQNLITSYALPPQTYLVCPPRSIYRKRAQQRPAQRHTYIAIKDGVDSKSRQLVCFTEDVHRASGEPKSPVKTSQRLHADQDVLCIDIVPVKADAESAASAFDVLIAHRGGHFQCISGNLDAKRWTHDGAGHEANTKRDGVQHATVVNTETARRGLLKGREDVTALLDTVASDAASRSLLCLIGTQARRCSLEVYLIRPRSTDGLTSQRPGLQKVLESDLPTQGGDHSATYSLHATSGKLQQLSSGTLMTFDLAGTVPRSESELVSSGSPFTSFARLSNSTLLAASVDACTIYETRYGSVQASLPLDSSSSAEVASKKRKLVEADTAHVPAIELIAYFTDSKLAVGLSGNELVALQCAASGQMPKRPKSTGTLLADVLGKGRANLSSKSGLPSTKEDQDWEAWKADVDRCVAASEYDALEQLIGRDFGATKEKKTQRGVQAEEQAELNGALDNDESLWHFPPDRSVLVQRTHRRKALYLLRKMFTTVHSDYNEHSHSETPITLTFYASNVFQWLALAGYVSRETLERTLEVDIQPGDLMKAIKDFDPDFWLVQEILAWPVHLDIDEVVQALALLVQSFNAPDPPMSRPMLPAPPGTDNGGINMMNGHQNDLDSDVEQESLAAESEWEHAMSALDSGLEIRSRAFRMVLARLHAFPQKTVTTTLRAMMSQQELVFFIHILRIELADGGWTSRYVDGGEEPDFGLLSTDLVGPADNAITTISDLLNCAVDAIGTSGWLVGLSSDVLGTQEMLASLRAEVSAGLEGCHEALALESFLGDFAKYGSELQKSRLQAPPPSLLINTDALTAEDVSLPIGARSALPVSRLYDGTGGKEGRKSKRLVGLERSRRVGKYSVERIRI